VVRAMVEHGTPISRLTSERVRAGDVERAHVEWRSLLRHIRYAPDHPWVRWGMLRALAEKNLSQTG
jgi:hypothetical protein